MRDEGFFHRISFSSANLSLSRFSILAAGERKYHETLAAK